MKGQTINGKYTIMAEINMIPFIDVALVLLIIFMVIAPVLVKSEILIKLPVTDKADKVSSDETPVRVQVNKEGVIFVKGNRVAAAGVDAALAGALLNPRTQSLLIEADQDVPFQHVVTVMSSAKKLGVIKMAVSVMEEKKGRRR